MPKRCVAAGCNRRADGIDFPRMLIKELNGQDKWLKHDWTGATDNSVLCSLFAKDIYKTAVLLSEEMGLPARKRKLKDSAVPAFLWS